ncbi:peptidoglycan DD-metalloendopeptidase family protein [Gleimia hominis]|uniref:Peptidoglycan DD-metalloendopeptidase family protein n=1 Tax=Gleimia hominis TaxID=595468 RepID=A0ABU3IAC3_9ACTO|nr:peptidoglycan DD-metalloendopeptidase family protein [Gleimia hominis]MDT3767322.1 peptidoglycan DD-metalloendopeptidase family protein [Gleimia hominis]
MRFRAGSIAAAVTAGLCALSLTGGLAFADRDDEVSKRDSAAAKSQELANQLNGLDANLAKLYANLQHVRNQLPGARTQVTQAKSKLAAAQREHEAAVNQLEVSQAQLDKLNEQAQARQDESDQSADAIADLAREYYRSAGEVSSPLVLALSAESTADISSRAAAAQTMTRSQSSVLEAAQGELAAIKNRMSRQKTLTNRVKKLEQKAAQARGAADSAAKSADAKLKTLRDLESEEKSNAKKAEQSKSQVAKQLQEQKAARDAAQAKINQIDEQNRRAKAQFAQASAPTTGSGGAVATSSAFGYPLPSVYPITSPFGGRYHPVLGMWIVHEGTDLGAPCGTNAIATANGQVTDVSYNGISGNYVTVNYGLIGGKSYQAMYMHLQRQVVSVGQRVSRGDTLGYVGSTGRSTGCHLHYEFIVNGQSVDGSQYF